MPDTRNVRGCNHLSTKEQTTFPLEMKVVDKQEGKKFWNIIINII